MQALPAPADAMRYAAFDDIQQFRFGAEFEPELPHSLVEAQGSAAQFWSQGGKLGGLALAVYSFDLLNYDEEAELRFIWSQQPSQGHLRVALANWQTQRWDWHTPGGFDQLALADLAPHIGPKGECLVVIALSGLQPGTLQRFSFGKVDEPVAVDITHIAPQGGSAGSMVRLGAKVAGDEPLTYAWDFGGGAVPNTSSEAEPLVQLGAEGSYPARLTVSNRFSSDTYGFSLQVIPVSNWVHTLGAKSFDNIMAVCADAMGDVYAAVCLSNGESSIAKFSPLGELQWIRRIDSVGPLTVTRMALAPDGNLLLGALHHQYDDQWELVDDGSLVLRLSPEADALGGFKLPSSGPIDFGADGSLLAADLDGNWLIKADSSSGSGWSCAMSSPDGLHFPDAGRACFGIDGSIWYGMRIEALVGEDDGPCISRITSAGEVLWSRFCPLVGQQDVTGIGALPGGVCVVVNPAQPFSAQESPRSYHMVAFDNAGSLLFRRHRASVGSLNNPVFAQGRIYVGGAERRERSDGSDYYAALSAYNLSGEQTGAWGLLSIPASVCQGLASHPDGSLLLAGNAENAYVSAYVPGDEPLGGLLPDYNPIELNTETSSFQASLIAFTTSERGLVLDSGGGEDDGLLIKFDPLH